MVLRTIMLIAITSFGFIGSIAAQGPGGGSIADRIQKDTELMFEKVSGLTEVQKQQITTINTQFGDSLQKMRDSGVAREDMREKMGTLRQDREKAIVAVLSEDQIVEYKAFRKEQRENRPKRDGQRPPKN